MKCIIDKQTGQKYWFDKDKFKKELKAYEKSRTKASLRKEIIERTNIPEDTVKDWFKIKNPHYPRDIEAIYVIEDLLNLKKGDLLLTYDPEEKIMNNTNNTNISDEERVAASKLYSTMYDMILQFGNNFPDDDPYAEYFVFKMRWTEHAQYKYANQEELRYKCLVDIRKTAIWFPQSMRDSLEDLVNKEFGPADYNYNEMAYGSENYKEYLAKNNLKDSYESRDLFETAFKRELFEELDNIFEKYLAK